MISLQNPIVTHVFLDIFALVIYIFDYIYIYIYIFAHLAGYSSSMQLLSDNCMSPTPTHTSPVHTTLLNSRCMHKAMFWLVSAFWQ
jgi:hypothetical protein